MDEKILGKESIEWFDKSRRQMQLLLSHFNTRAKLEQNMETQWMSLSNKLQKRFEVLMKDYPQPIGQSTSAENIMALVTKHLAEEPKENAKICSAVKDSMKRKRQGPSAIIKRWLFDPFENTTCVEEKEFKDAYHAAVDNLAKKEKNVENAKQVLQESIKSYRSIEEETARKAYRRAILEHEAEKSSFIETMSKLHKCMDSYEKNRLSVLKHALDSYEAAIAQHETRRDSRKLCLKQLADMAEYLSGSSVEEIVNKWLDSIQTPLSAPVFVYDPYPYEMPATVPESKVKEHASVEPKESKEEEQQDEQLKPKRSSLRRRRVSPGIPKRKKSTTEARKISTKETNQLFSIEKSIPPAQSLVPVLQSVAHKSSKEKTSAQTTPELWLQDIDSEEDSVPVLNRNLAEDPLKQDGVTGAPLSDDLEHKATDVATDVSMAAHVYVYAKNSYTNISSDHLTFSKGQTIKQKKPANVDGLAYGYMITNKFTRKKKYGFYPANLVALKGSSKRKG